MAKSGGAMGWTLLENSDDGRCGPVLLMFLEGDDFRLRIAGPGS